jgi:NAD(P)-dependent dehydrogenase (short-subunit alcohol dehydrogenase family)
MTGGYLAALRLDGRGVVVLGVGPGIGGAVCDAVAEAGGSLLCVDLDPAAAERTAARCGGKAMAVDVTDRDALTAVFDRAEELFGGDFYGVVDVVGVTRPGLLADETEETMTRQFDLVLRHVLLLTQIAHPRLAGSGRGSVVFIGSLAGEANTRRLGLYGAAKAAVHHLAGAAAVEFGPSGVRTNVIVTGRILGSGTTGTPDPAVLDTLRRAIPSGRTGVPEDIAGAVLFLLSDLSGYVNGVRLPVDGGISTVSPLPSSQAANQPGAVPAGH